MHEVGKGGKHLTEQPIKRTAAHFAIQNKACVADPLLEPHLRPQLALGVTNRPVQVTLGQHSAFKLHHLLHRLLLLIGVAHELHKLLRCVLKLLQQLVARALDRHTAARDNLRTERARECESTRARERKSTRARERKSTRARERESTRAREQNSTRAREHKSTRARERESTRAREHESTRAREHESA